MRYFVSFTTGLVVIIAFTFLISGCGSDDERVSSPPEPQSPFSGEYHYVQMTGVSNQNNTPFRSETGRLVTARKDSVRFEAAHVAYNGSLEGPINPPDRLLDLMDDRGVVFTDPAGFVVQGRFRPDGGFAVLHSDKADAQLGFLLAARRNPAPVQDDFEGKWGLVQYGLIQATPPATGQIGLGARGKVLVDGNGGIEFQEYTYNRGGKVNPMRVFHVPSELVPDGDGGVVWRNLSLNQVEFIGGLSEDGNLILLGAVGGFNGQAGIRVLVREGLTSSLAEVAGNYLSGGCTMKDSMIPPGPFAMNERKRSRIVDNHYPLVGPAALALGLQPGIRRLCGDEHQYGTCSSGRGRSSGGLPDHGGTVSIRGVGTLVPGGGAVTFGGTDPVGGDILSRLAEWRN